jgi:hypothetical protein
MPIFKRPLSERKPPLVTVDDLFRWLRLDKPKLAQADDLLARFYQSSSQDNDGLRKANRRLFEVIRAVKRGEERSAGLVECELDAPLGQLFALLAKTSSTD